MRIIQMHISLIPGDAIGNDMFAIRNALRKRGIPSILAAKNIAKEVSPGDAQTIESLASPEKDDLILYHYSAGDDLNLQFAGMQGRKILFYHNVTPASFFEAYSESMAYTCRLALEQLPVLFNCVERCVAVSKYNAVCLREAGFQGTVDVIPILIPFDDYKKPADRQLLAKYQNDGIKNLMFCGRIAPNKKIENVLETFYYLSRIRNKIRLFIVGSDFIPAYSNRLRIYADRLGISDQVVFTGHVSFSQVLAYYQLADVYLSMSEHEGFCVPLIEAMFFNIPIVALDAAAVSETLSGSGVLIAKEGGSAEAAAAADRVLSDNAYRQKIVCDERDRLAWFESDRIEKQLTGYIERAIDLKQGNENQETH